MMKGRLKSWKTTLAGAVVLVGMFGPMTGLLNEKQAASISGVAVAFGLAAAKDSDVTGGTRQQ